jgi:recombination protein RecT
MTKALAPWENAIATAKNRFNDIIQSSGNAVNYQSEAMFAMQAIENSDYLQKCHPDSIRNAVINVASIGLTLNPAMKMAYLVPRDGLATLDISYIGLVKLATDSSGIKYVCADVVRREDKFLFKGKDDKPVHEYNPFSSNEDRGEILGVYCYVKLQDGDYLTEVMDRKTIEGIRQISKAPNSPAWKNHYGEMAKKAVIKRAQKLWPKSDGRLQSAIHVLNEHEGLKDINNEPEPTIPQPKRKSDSDAIDVDPETGEIQEPVQEEQGINAGQQKVLKAKIKALGVDENELLSEFNIDSIPDLPASKINDALKWVEGASSGN